MNKDHRTCDRRAGSASDAPCRVFAAQGDHVVLTDVLPKEGAEGC